MDDESLAGVLDIVDIEEADLHQKTAPVKTETKTEAPKTETKTETKTENKNVEADEPDDAENQDTQDFSRTLADETEDDDADDTTEPSKTETETKAEDAANEDEFQPTLAPEPQFLLEAPQYDADGYITNMTPQQYENYVISKAQFNMQHQAWVTGNESQALDAAEKILPQIKTSTAVRQMVENARVASILNGQQINSYEAAKLVKEALGLSTKEVSQKVAQAKAEGAQNAKVSITIQKNAAVETPSPKKKTTDPKQAALTKRLKAGDDSAFEDLLSQWDKEGKL